MNECLDLYNVFIFDFDGTLIESNHLKNDAFLELTETDNERFEMEKLLEDKSLTRYEILNLYAEFTGRLYEPMIKLLNQLIRQKLLKANKRKGSQLLIESIISAGKNIYINSLTPDRELKPIVKVHFDMIKNENIFGSSKSKSDNIRDILLKSNYQGTRNIVFIGDGIDDYMASKTKELDFIGISGGTLEKTGPIDTKRLVSSFDQISKINIVKTIQ